MESRREALDRRPIEDRRCVPASAVRKPARRSLRFVHGVLPHDHAEVVLRLGEQAVRVDELYPDLLASAFHS